MSEKHNYDEASSFDSARPQPSAEQAMSVRRLYSRLTSFAVTNGEPVRLEYFGVNELITQTRETDIGKSSCPFDEFSDDGQYIGERNIRYVDANSREQKARLIVANENGMRKLDVLAELNLEEAADQNHCSHHTYRIYPDMNIGYVREDWEYEGDGEDDFFYDSSETERRFLDATEVDALSILVDSLHMIPS